MKIARSGFWALLEQLCLLSKPDVSEPPTEETRPPEPPSEADLPAEPKPPEPPLNALSELCRSPCEDTPAPPPVLSGIELPPERPHFSPKCLQRPDALEATPPVPAAPPRLTALRP
jgi:hypothetical protein